MISTTLFPGRYVQGPDSLHRLGKEVLRMGKNAFIICDPFVHKNLLPDFIDFLEEHLETNIISFGGECSDEEIQKLVEIGRNQEAEVIVGIGGGKTLDTAKAVGYEMKKPVAIVPTLASTDAPCSALSVIYTAEGEFKRYLILDKNPDLVLLDTKVVVKAPSRFLVSGMGDALATWFEAESCMRSYAGNMTGDVGSMTAYSLAKLCYNTLLDYGLAAKQACDAHAVSPAVEHVVEANTLLSGLGFESGGLASAHAIHNGFTVLEPTHNYFHGEKVAFGTLASLVLTDKDKATLDKVYSFCESIGLPTTLADIGLKDVSDDDLMKVAESATAEGETIHNESLKVTAEKVFFAIKIADQIGRERKK